MCPKLRHKSFHSSASEKMSVTWVNWPKFCSNRLVVTFHMIFSYVKILDTKNGKGKNGNLLTFYSVLELDFEEPNYIQDQRNRIHI